MGEFNFSLLIVVVILSIIVSIFLTIFTDLSLWLTIPLSPILSFTALTAVSLIIELFENNNKSDNTLPSEIPSDFIQSMKPDNLLCPSCGSENIAEIIYGLPVVTDEMEKELERGNITLGGCMVYEDAPLWMCNVCDCKFNHAINKEHAIKIVQNIIRNYDSPEDDEYIVIESGTIEKEWGWVVFHTSKKYYQTNDIKYAVAGNAPFIVLRKNGRVIETGTAYSIEHYIKHFEETGDPHG